MKKGIFFLWATLVALFFFTASIQAQTVVKVRGYCERGGQRVQSGGSQSTTTVQKTYPGCTVRVVNTGTSTLTSIYSTTGLTVKSNPFVADSTTGYWEFYVLKAARLDIELSGGLSPNNIASPFYWAVDYSAAGEALPTIYNQTVIEQTYDVPSVALPQRTKLEVGAGLNVEDDATTGSTLIKSSGAVTGKLNIVTDFGGNSLDTTTTGTITSGSTLLTMASLLAYRKGMYICIPGLGVAGANFYARITDINTATKVFTLDASPAGNGTNVTVYPDNFTPIQNALNTVRGAIYFPAGFYRVWNDYNRVLTIRGFVANVQGGEGNPTIIEGDGQGSSWIRAMGDADLFRATSRQDLENLQVKNINFEANGGINNTTSRGWAFNLGTAKVVNFPEWHNVQIKGFRGGIFCANCQGGGIWNSVFRGNKLAAIAMVTDQTTWIPGNENNGLAIKSNQVDFQADPNTNSNRTVTGLSMVWEDDNVAVTDLSYIVTAATSQFVADDLGRILEIPTEGTDGGNLIGIILEVISGTQVRYSTRGVRTAPTAFTGATGTIYRVPLASMYIVRANWLSLHDNVLQGNFGLSTAAVNTVHIRNSNSVNIKNLYSEQGGGSGGAHLRLEDSFGISIEGFKTNSQGTCTPTPPLNVTSHCWDIWATNVPGIRVKNAAGSLSILHNKLEGTSTIHTEGLYGAPDLSNETGPQKEVYGDYHRNFQWGNVQIGTNTLYDATYGDNMFTDGRLVDGLTTWTTVVPSSVTYRTDGADRFKNYFRVDTTALATASITELITKRINIPDGLMSQNAVLAFDYRPVTYPVGSDDTYSVDFYAKPSTGGTGYNWPTTFNWQIPGNNAAGLTPGYWYRLQVNLVIPEGTGRYFDIAIRARRGALTPIVDFTNFMLMQGRHAAFSNKQPITDVDGGKIYGNVYLPNLASGTDQTLGIEATTGKVKIVASGGGGGGVSSVGMTVPSWLSVTGSPVTGSGTLAVSSATVCANCAVIGPNGTTGALTARALISADLPGLDTSKLVTGQLAVARGGTGLAAAANNNVLVGDGTSWNSIVLPSCSNGTTDKLLYNTSTRVFTCGVDQTSGGGAGITSLGVSGSPQTGATQTLATVNDTNVTASWGSASNTHTLTLGWTGRLDPTRQDANTVYNQSTNTYTGGDQDMRGADGFYVPVYAGYTPATSALFGYDSTANLYVGGHGGTSKKFITTANSLGQVTNADVASAAAIALSKLAATTASRALVSDASGFVSASTVTSTELGHLSGVSSAIQTQLNNKQATGNYITGLTTDVVATGPGTVAATIQPGAVTYSKMQAVANNNRVLGAVTAGTVAELTGTQVTAMLDAFTTSAKGLVPSPGGVSNTTDFLRRDGTWAAPSGGGGSGIAVGDSPTLTGAWTWQRSGSSILAAGPTGATNPTFAVDTTNGGIILGRNRSDYSAVLSMATSAMQFPIIANVTKPSDDGFENDNVYELNSNWDGAVATHPKWQMNIENFYRIPASGQRLIEVNWSYSSIDRATSYRPFNFQVDVDTHEAGMNWRVKNYDINSRTGGPFFSVDTSAPSITAAAPITAQSVTIGSSYNLTFANAGIIRSTATHLDLQDNNTNRVHIAVGGGKIGFGNNNPQAQYEFTAANKALAIGASTLSSGQATGLLLYAPNFGSAGLRWSNDSSNNVYLESANSSVTPNNWHDGANVNLVVRKGRLGVNATSPSAALNVVSTATNLAAAVLQQLTGTTASQPVLTVNDASGLTSAHITGGGQIQFYDSGGGMRARLGMASWDNGYMSLQTGILSESAANAALYQSSGGATAVNSASGQSLSLRIANAALGTLTSSSFSMSVPIIQSGTPQTLTGAGAVNLTTYSTLLVTTGANALTLAAGSEGQFKFIRMKTDGGDGTLTVTNLEGGTTVTFNDAGDFVYMLYQDGKWHILTNSGCAIA